MAWLTGYRANGQAVFSRAQGTIALLVILGTIYLLVEARPIPDWWILLVGNVVGFYFGQGTLPTPHSHSLPPPATTETNPPATLDAR